MHIRSSQREYGHVQVLGHIWQPGIGPCAMERDLSDYDVGNIEQPVTRETVLDWVYLHMGDFREILDFSAYVKGVDTVEIPWENEENEFTYMDAMYPSED